MNMLEYYALALRNAETLFNHSHDRTCAEARALPLGVFTSRAYRLASEQQTAAASEYLNVRGSFIKTASTGDFSSETSDLCRAATQYKAAKVAWLAAEKEDDRLAAVSGEAYEFDSAPSRVECRRLATLLCRAEEELFTAASKFAV